MDVVRGICIISMVIAHVAGGSLLYKLSHAAIWVDGSMGFVFLSGLVMGTMHQRRTERARAFRPSALVMLRRVRLLWILNFAITVLALLLGTFRPTREYLPSFDELGVFGSLWRAAVLALNPPLSILGMYVVLMIVAVGAVWLLYRQHSALLIGVSAVVYVVAAATGVDTALPGQGSDQAFHLAAWQFLFILGLTLGWHWDRLHLRERVLRPWVVAVSAVAVLAFTGLAHVTVRMDAFEGTAADDVLRRAFEKLDLGPAAIVFTLAAGIVAYAAATWVLRSRVHAVVNPVVTLGKRSLDSYVISTALAMALPAVLTYSFGGVVAQLLAVGTLVVCWCWAVYKLHRKHQASLVAA